MDDILRFDGAVQHDPAIDAWLESRPPEHRGVVQKWFLRMRRCGPDVRELIHDGAPTACVGDVAFGYVNAFRSHVNVGFFNGAKLPDPFELLEGTGKRMRHVKIKPSEVVDAHALDELIRAAHADARRRAAVET